MRCAFITSYERDGETELDFAQARYYGYGHGRFISVDAFGSWAMTEDEKAEFLREPQRWNRYAYVAGKQNGFSSRASPRFLKRQRVKKFVPSTGETTVFVYDVSGKTVAEYSTIVETINAKVSYLTSDHLGSPRITTDADGKVISRRDFHPFGEEIATTERTVGLGYEDDTIRQKFTSYERDVETDLDFAKARMYKYSHGRFTSPDPLLSSGTIYDPQTWNRYSYSLNNPVRFTDPTGLYVGMNHSEAIQPTSNFLMRLAKIKRS